MIHNASQEVGREREKKEKEERKGGREEPVASFQQNLGRSTGPVTVPIHIGTIPTPGDTGRGLTG